MKIIAILLCFFAVKSYSGTGVGSPFIEQLPAFDYQMAFPSTWKVSNNDITGHEGLFKEWIANNEPIVGLSNKSEIRIEFLSNFPVNTLSELYTEIQSRHVSFTFSSASNRQISGWTSALIQNGNDFENWEYYFIAPKKVVRIHTLRKKDGFGLSHTEIIIRSIRKISEGIKFTQVQFENTLGSVNSINVGDKVCYRFIFDYPKELQSETMISAFKLRYETVNTELPIEKKVIKTRSYNLNTGIHSVCFNILTGMGKRDHFIKEMEYDIDGNFSSQMCSYQPSQISCGSSSFSLNVPELSVQRVDKLGPSIGGFKFDQINNVLKIQVSDPSDIQLIQLFGVRQEDSEQSRIGVIFPDQITNGEVNFRFKREFGPATFINTIYFTDKSGNTSALIRKSESDLVYSFKQINNQPIKTNFPIIGW